jgi:hypothetical protein
MTRLALWIRLPAVLATMVASGAAGAVTVPPEGACPPYPLESTLGEAAHEDVVPPQLTLGERIELSGLQQIRRYLPPEVWARRDLFFHEGMRLEIGPCHRRYPAPEFFRNATRKNAGRADLDADGNLVGYEGEGLPFAAETIPDDASDAGQRWAWNYRYRYMGAGFRGPFRIVHVDPRKGKGSQHEGTFSWLPLHGIPGLPRSVPRGYGFAAAGKFDKPAIARGVAWRQLRPREVDQDYRRSDELFVWIPEQRKVRRAPPQSVDGLFMPAYRRGQMGDAGVMALPDGGTRVPDASLAVVEHQRRGFIGLMLRPNAYRFHLVRVQDVLAPLNSNRFGYPADPDRSYGPTGLSLATDRWELRRAVVLRGTRRDPDRIVHSVGLYVDVLTGQPLYFVSRRGNELIYEVGILMGKFSADDPLQPRWAGNDEGSGVILPVAAAFFVAGRESWLRESFELRSDPPEKDEFNDLTTTKRLVQGR